jgi:type II secretory pathway component PulM
MQTVATIVFGIIALVIVIKAVVPYWRGLSKREREDIVGVCLFLLMVIGVFLCLMAWFIM